MTTPSESLRLSCYAVDDEELALAGLVRLLEETGRVAVRGWATDPEIAARELAVQAVDVLFLDILMPELDGFGLLARLTRPPLVVFTTAYDEHALRAFEVDSVDYLLKPVTRPRLARALDKLERLHTLGAAPRLDGLLQRLEHLLPAPAGGRLERVASRVGDRTVFVDLADVTHFAARDQCTFACTDGRSHLIDLSLGELETRLDAQQWIRVHRAAIVNVRHVGELSRWFAGKLTLLLRDRNRTELTVSRDRVQALRRALGIGI